MGRPKGSTNASTLAAERAAKKNSMSVADFFTKQPRQPRKSSSVLGAHLTPAKTPAAVGPPPSGVTEDDVAAMMLGLSGQPLTPGTSLDQQLQTGQLQAAWRNESGLWRSLSAEQWKMIERVVGGPLGFVDKSGRLAAYMDGTPQLQGKIGGRCFSSAVPRPRRKTWRLSQPPTHLLENCNDRTNFSSLNCGRFATLRATF